MNPFERCIEKEKLILELLRDETFSSVENVGLHIQTRRNSAYTALKRMEKKGLVQQHYIQWKIAQSGRLSIWGLTPKGSYSLPDDGHCRHYSANRVSIHTIEHSLEIQKAKIFALKAGWRDWFCSRKVYQIAHQDPSIWLQIPDALATSPKGERMAIELERTAKGTLRYRNITENYCQMFLDRTVNRVVYICSENIKNSVEKRLLSPTEILLNGRINKFNESFKNRFAFTTTEGWEQDAQNF